MIHVNLRIAADQLEEVDRRNSGDHGGWNRSSAVRAMLAFYLRLVEAPLPELPTGALAVLRTLLPTPRDLTPQLLDLLPDVVRRNSSLERTCAHHQVDPQELVGSLRSLSREEVLVVLDRLLLETPR